MARKPNPDKLNRAQIEKWLNENTEKQDIPSLRYKLALYRRLKQYEDIPPPSQRDPDFAYPVRRRT